MKRRVESRRVSVEQILRISRYCDFKNSYPLLSTIEHDTKLRMDMNYEFCTLTNNMFNVVHSSDDHTDLEGNVTH